MGRFQRAIERYRAKRWKGRGKKRTGQKGRTWLPVLVLFLLLLCIYYMCRVLAAEWSLYQALKEERVWNRKIAAELVCFPIAGEQKEYTFSDNWHTKRTYGGERLHEGIDLFDRENERGRLSVVSMTDGVVEKLGWLEQGGYRIGVRTASGIYLYYAHFYEYADGLEEGSVVKAGDLLGYMGDSGYGSEGTVGQFDVHLHIGIYIEKDGEETAVNPYRFLLLLEGKTEFQTE